MLTPLIFKSSTGPNLTCSCPPAILRTQLPKIYHNVILPFLTGLASKRFPTHLQKNVHRTLLLGCFYLLYLLYSNLSRVFCS